MAITAFGTNDEQTVKLWSRTLEREILPATLFNKFLGKTMDHAVQERDDTSKGAGDRIRVSLVQLLDSDGVSGNQPLEGNESRRNFLYQDISLDQLRNAVRHYTRVDQQRVVHNIREDSKVGLRDWFADFLDRGFINQITGNTLEADIKKTGMVAPTAPDSDHWIYGGTAGHVTEATLAANDEFTIDLLDKAAEKIKMFRERGEGMLFRPFKGGYYGAILSPAQIYDLRTNTSTGQWLDIQKAALQGGQVGDNPIFTGSLGVYNNFVIYEDSRIPKGNNGTAYLNNTRRAVVFGAQSCFCCFGREGGRPDRFLWNEESFDFGNEHAVAASLIWGLEKAVFNSKDYATLAISTYTTTN